MNPNRFDVLSRALAGGSRVSRRQAVGRTGRAGLAAGLLAAIGLRAAEVADARQANAGEVPDRCTLAFATTALIGPSAEEREGRVVRGELRLPIARDGDIAGGRFRRDDGEEFAVQGQATGRVVTLRIAMPGDGLIVAVGAGAEPFAACASIFAGLTRGPAIGDLGEWTAAPVRDARGVCPDEIRCAMDAPCDDGLRQTVDCECVSVGNAVCDVACDEGQTLTDDCNCVCLI